MPTAVLLSLVLAGQAPLTPKQVYERCRDSVVSIDVDTGKETFTGTGFFYQNGRTVATAFHVLLGAKHITIRARGGDSWAPIGVSIDVAGDTAILRLGADSGRRPISHAPSDSVEVGDPVYVIGDPLGLTGSLSTGIVGALRSVKGVPMVQMTAAVSHGSSGGPVLDAHGRAIGVVSYMLTEGQNLNMAVSTKIAKGLLASNEVLTMAELETVAADVVKEPTSGGDTGKGKRTADPEMDAAALEAERLPIEEAQVRFNVALGKVYGALDIAEMRWTLTWQDVVTTQGWESAAGKIDQAQRELEAAYPKAAVWKGLLALGLRAQIPRADLDIIAKSLDELPEAIRASGTAQNAVVQASAATLDAANKKMVAAWQLVHDRIDALYTVSTDKTWQGGVFFEAIPALVKSSWLLDRFHAFPDFDLPNSCYLSGRGSWKTSELQRGDRIVGIAVEGPNPVFQRVSNWTEFYEYYEKHCFDGIHVVLQAAHGGGSTFVVHESAEKE